MLAAVGQRCLTLAVGAGLCVASLREGRGRHGERRPGGRGAAIPPTLRGLTKSGGGGRAGSENEPQQPGAHQQETAEHGSAAGSVSWAWGGTWMALSPPLPGTGSPRPGLRWAQDAGGRLGGRARLHVKVHTWVWRAQWPATASLPPSRKCPVSPPGPGPGQAHPLEVTGACPECGGPTGVARGTCPEEGTQAAQPLLPLPPLCSPHTRQAPLASGHPTGPPATPAAHNLPTFCLWAASGPLSSDLFFTNSFFSSISK